jgi:hypothetical protein
MVQQAHRIPFSEKSALVLAGQPVFATVALITQMKRIKVEKSA